MSAHDPDPVKIINAVAASPFLLTGDHAGNLVPSALGTLGLADKELERHIGWDIGVAGIGALMSARMQASFVSQAYSRLVIDCNRDPQSPEAMPVLADGTRIAGNEGLDRDARNARIAAIFDPYQAAIAASIAFRIASGPRPILIALHSFTPSLSGIVRPWHVGVLHSDGNTDFARSLLAALRRNDEIIVGDNEPYRMDATDYTVPRHAFSSGLAYAEIEVRQDLIGDRAGQKKWAGILAQALQEAAGIDPPPP